VRANWAGCGCPDGTRYVSTRGRTRGWSCVKNTAKGSRFVKAVCRVAGAGAHLLPSSAREDKPPIIVRPRARPKLLSSGEDGPAKNAIVVRQRDALARRRAVEAETLLSPRDVLIVDSGPLAPPRKRTRLGQQKKASKGKVDWSRCKCPSGATLHKTKTGQVCKQKNKFVKAVCS